MSFNEKFRGQTNSIILFILKDGDRHTDELKEIIDTTFSEVKIGTLYSIIARMKTQGQISEYRASSNDGSRRKYYKITNKGLKEFDSQFAYLFEGYTLPKKEEVSKTSYPIESEIENDEFLNYIKKAEDFEPIEIDFSEIEKKPEEKIVIEEKNQEIIDTIPYLYEEESKSQEKGEDFDSLISSNYEYKSVLEKLFPKPQEKVEETVKFEDVKVEFNAPVEESEIKINSLDAIYELSEQENIKIRTSNDTNRYQGTKILANKLKFHSAILLTIISALEYLLLAFVFYNVVQFNATTLLRIVIIFASFVVFNGTIYILKPNHSVKDLPKFINSIEIAIVLALSVIIISICVASINSIDIYDINSVFNNILLPSVLAINIPIYVALNHFLSKVDFYQTV